MQREGFAAVAAFALGGLFPAGAITGIADEDLGLVGPRLYFLAMVRAPSDGGSPLMGTRQSIARAVDCKARQR
ncbi:hypothetical protein BGI51_12895 [Pseudomonas oryzihabitans]|nr:hypothetical protein BGI51_12895 [Pseudomonas psychrotolerans]